MQYAADNTQSAAMREPLQKSARFRSSETLHILSPQIRDVVPMMLGAGFFCNSGWTLLA